MTRLATFRRPLAAAAAALALAGCVSVLPKAAPVQLYRFGADAAGPPPAGATAANAPGLVLSGVTLPRASAGDGLLTVTGDEAAYIAGARWVSPAAVLMEEAAERAFSARAGRVRLLRRNELAGASGFLTLDVHDFEARYPSSSGAPGAAPVVRVVVHAVIARRDGAFAAERTFAVDQPADANRLSAIVPAYDAAVRAVLGQVAAWADTAAQALPPAGAAPVSPTPRG